MVEEYLDKLFDELKVTFDGVNEKEVDRVADLISEAKRIFLFGLGRVGISSRAFAMRLVHLGKPSYWIPDDSTPSIGEGDLLIANSGSGESLSTYTCASKAKEAGSKVACITSNPQGRIPQVADAFINLPALTYYIDQEGSSSILPMGSQFELALWILQDLLVLRVMEKIGYTEAMMSSNHRNIEF